MDEVVANAIVAQRKKDKSITWQPYLPHEDKQDIQEIYERLDVDSKGYITQQELHTALNDALGKPVRAETVRALALRMDVSSRRGQHVSYHDFVEYMAQKLLIKESYDDLMRTEQGILMREVGYKLHEVLSMFKRKQMIKDAMMGQDGIARLLHLTNVPVQHRNRRKGQTGSDLLRSETGTASSPAARHRPQRPASGVTKSAVTLAASNPAGESGSRSSASVAFRSSQGQGLSPDEPEGLVAATPSRASLAAVPSSMSKTKSSRSRQARHSNGAVSRVASSVSSAGGRLSDEKNSKEKDKEKERELEPVARWRKGMGLPATDDSSLAIAWAAEDAVAFVGELSGLNKRLKEDLASFKHPHPHPQQQQQQQLPHPAGSLPHSRPSVSAASTPNSSGSLPGSPSAQTTPAAAAAAGFPTVSACDSPEQSADGLSAPSSSKHRSLSTTSASVPQPVLVPRTPLGFGIPGRGGSRCASPAPSPLGPACQLLIGAPPVSGPGSSWRSPALFSQVMDLEQTGMTESQFLSSEDPHSHSVFANNSHAQLHAHLPQHRSQVRKPPTLWGAARVTAPAGISPASPGTPPPAIGPVRSQTFPSPQPWSPGPPGGSGATTTTVSPVQPGRPNSGTLSGQMPPLATTGGMARASQEGYEAEVVGSDQQLQQQQHPHQHRNSQQQHQAQQQHSQSSSQLLPPPQPHPQHPPQQQSLLQTLSLQASDEDRGAPGVEGSRRAKTAEGIAASLARQGQQRPRPRRASLSSAPGQRQRPQLTSRVPSAEIPRLEVSVDPAAAPTAATPTAPAPAADPLASDPVLAKLPNWVRKGIGLPTAPLEPPLQLEPRTQQPLALASAAAPVTEAGAETESTPSEAPTFLEAPTSAALQNPSQDPSQRGVEVGSQSAGLKGGHAAAGRLGHVPSGRTPTVRFMPFGGDSAAVVTEAAEEGEGATTEEGGKAARSGPSSSSSPAPSSKGAPLAPVSKPAGAILAEEDMTPPPPAWDRAGGEGPSDGGSTSTSSGEEGLPNPFLAAFRSAGVASQTGPNRSHSWHVGGPDGPSSGSAHPAEVQGALAISRPSSARFFEPKFFSFRHSRPPTAEGAADGVPSGVVEQDEGKDVGIGVGQGGGGMHPMSEQLAAWEASVLSHRSSVGHGSLPGRERDSNREEEQDADEEDDGGPESAGAIYERLFGTRAKGAAHGPHGAQQHTSAGSATSAGVDVAGSAHGLAHQPTSSAAGVVAAGSVEVGASKGGEPAASTACAGSAGDGDGADASGGQDGGYTSPPQPSLAAPVAPFLVRIPYMEPVPVNLPSTRAPPAGAVAAAAMAAVAVAEQQRTTAGLGGPGSNSASSSSNSTGLIPRETSHVTHWSAGYVPENGPGAAAAGAVPDGIAARPRVPAVRLNHTAMLRLHTQYSGEAIAAAGAALGVGGTSSAARDVATRGLLQALGSARGPGGGRRRMCGCAAAGPSSQGSTAAEGSGAHGLRGNSSSGSGSNSSGYCCSGGGDSGSGGGGGGGSGGGGGGGVYGSRGSGLGRDRGGMGPRGAVADAGLHPTPLNLLPSDVIGLSRTYHRQSRNGGRVPEAVPSPSSSSYDQPRRNAASRPSSASLTAGEAAAGPSGPRSRPASAVPTGLAQGWPSGSVRTASASGTNPLAGNRIVPTAAPAAHAGPQGGAATNWALASASAAASASGLVPPAPGPPPRLPRPESARAPVNHSPPSIVSRVRHLHEGEVASCLSAAAALPAVASPPGSGQRSGGTGNGGGSPPHPSYARPQTPTSPPALGSSPSSGSIPGGLQVVQDTVTGEGAPVLGSSPPREGKQLRGSRDGSGGEETRRRMLEVMGTGTGASFVRRGSVSGAPNGVR